VFWRHVRAEQIVAEGCSEAVERQLSTASAAANDRSVARRFRPPIRQEPAHQLRPDDHVSAVGPTDSIGRVPARHPGPAAPLIMSAPKKRTASATIHADREIREHRTGGEETCCVGLHVL